MMSKDEIIPWLYFIIGIATFAWSASDPAHLCEPQDLNCFEVFDRVASGTGAGIAWPLYWTWAAAEEIREITS